MLVRVLLATVVALALPGTASAGIPPLSQTGLDEVLKTATAQKKAVLIEFSTKWCVACRELDKGLLKNWKVARALNDIVFVRYDAEDVVGNDAAGRYRVNAFPTFLAIDKNGLERFRRTGGEVANVDNFLDLVSDTKALFEDEAVIRQRLKDNPHDTQTKLDAAKWYAARKQAREALRELDAITRSTASASEKAEASHVADRLRRIAQWKEQLVKASVKSLHGDPANASADDLIIASIGSDLPDSAIRALFKEVAKAHADSDDLVPFVYIALAAGLSSDALASAEALTHQSSDPKRLALLAECKYATGDRDGALQTLDAAIFVAKGTPLETQLKFDRERIDGSRGDAAQVIQARLKASDLWQRVETLDQLKFVPTPNPGGGGLLALVRAVQKLSATVGGACASDAAGAERAFGRLGIDNATGQVVSITLYMQDSANKALRDCIEKQLHAAQLPIIATAVPEQKATFYFPKQP